MSRKALVVGIDYYAQSKPLFGCVNDSHAVKATLDRHYDGTKNFDCKHLTGTGPSDPVNRIDLREQVQNLFSDAPEIALFYFAGHGYLDEVGGYLITSDCQSGDDGLALNEIIAFANNSKAKTRIIILDSCHSGIAGNRGVTDSHAVINTGVTILTASTQTQYAAEVSGAGLFTGLFVDALNGGAANLLGEITPGSVYAHIDQSLGPWDQRPLFKTNVSNFVSLRRVRPPIELERLRKLRAMFPDPSYEFKLDPSFEPASTNPNLANNEKFSDLQKMAGVNLVRPVGEDHMYYAAMNSKSCRLTVLGEHYWRLLDRDVI